MKRLQYLLLLGTIATVGSSAQSLENILLIINYNFAHYQSIPLLTRIYKKQFKDIVFYGPEQGQGVTQYNLNNGYLSYMCIADAMKKYPTCSGYFFLMDDCILNAQFLVSLDQSKIWFPEISFLNGVRGNMLNILKKADATNWAWWHTQWGWQAMLKAYTELSESYRQVLDQNCDSSCIMAAYSDLVYIPACYKDKFVELAELFGKYEVFLEMALPTIVACLCNRTEWVWLRGHGIDRKDPVSNFKLEEYFNHPMKLSDQATYNFIEKIFNAKG
ncbi:MAG TPA: hypothetical protein VLG71_02680 [Candidatus Limnocylindria bacterium]|nr:hypothetical protein [Candidatus Limnocylindria bacterium]